MNTAFFENIVLFDEGFFMQNYNKQNLKVLHSLLKFLMETMLFLFWGLLLFAFDKAYLAVLTLLCAIIHEGGHIACTLICMKKMTLRAVGNGFRIKVESQLSYVKEILISVAGPLINITVFALLSPVKTNSYISDFAILNLLTALSNLLPIEGYDGYRILNCTLKLLEIPTGENILSKASFASCILLCFISLFLIMKIDYGYWIYFVFLATIFKKIQSNQRLLFARKREISREFERFQEIYRSESGNKGE